MNERPVTAYVALGSNLGDRRGVINEALRKLGESPGVKVIRVSSLHETAAVGGPPDSPAFLNAAAEIETTVSPRALLQTFLDVESHLGRRRREKWEPRLIDLDLLLYGDETIDEPDLKVPHPLMQERRFVLAPLAEIAPKRIHPASRRSVIELLESLNETT